MLYPFADMCNIQAVLQILHIDEKELFLSGCRLIDMDPSISVFESNIGSVNCPDDFVEDSESEVILEFHLFWIG